jgi:hypothetical protein
MMMMMIKARRAPLIKLVRATWRVPLGLMPVMAAIATMTTTMPSQASQVMTRQHTRAGYLGVCRISQSGVRARSNRSPLSVTATVAPVSATTASHNGAAPSTAETRNASLVASASVTFWRITRNARFA